MVSHADVRISMNKSCVVSHCGRFVYTAAYLDGSIKAHLVNSVILARFFNIMFFMLADWGVGQVISFVPFRLTPLQFPA